MAALLQNFSSTYEPHIQNEPDDSGSDPSPPASTGSVEEGGAEMDDQDSWPGDEEGEFLVLDPDHPIIRKYQDEMNRQLKQRLESVEQALREKRALEKADAMHMQHLGGEVSRVQERLARVQKKLADRQQTKTQAEAKRQQALQQLEEMKSQHSSMATKVCEAKASVSQLQAQLDNMTQQLVLTQGVSEGLRSEVRATKNARCKAAAEKTRTEDQKLKQDLYVDRLTKELDRLTQQIALYEVQARAQAEETQRVKGDLCEAEVEMESLSVSRKQLLQHWDSSIKRMRAQDEAFSAMQEALREAKHRVTLLDKEIDGYKKSLAAEQEQNEALTKQLNWSQTYCTTSRKLISEKQAQQQALQAHYSTCLLTVQETERTLVALSRELASHQAQANDQRRQLEKESSVRLELEKNITTCTLQKLLHNKAAKHSKVLTDETAARKKEKMYQLKQLEEELLMAKLESERIDQRVGSLALTHEALDQEVQKSNKLLTVNQAKAAAFIRLIKQRQSTIIGYRKMISQIAARTGHDDLSPLHIKIQSVMDQIEELAANKKRDHQLWMKQQWTLTGLTQTLEAISREVLKLQTEHTGLRQIKIYMESKIQSERREEAELEKSSERLRRDLLKLNTLLSEKSHLSQALEQKHALMKADLRHRLKDAEREAVQMQMNLEKLQEDKENLLNCLVEAERQIMLWERKKQLAKEIRSAVDVGQGEIASMRAEMHRKELRLSQLMKQQKQVQRECETAVVRREKLVLRKDAKKPQQAKKVNLSFSIQGLQRKIRKTRKQVAEYEQMIDELQKQKESLRDEIRQKEVQLTELRATACTLDSDMVALQDTRERNQAHIISLQRRAKRLQLVCEGRYQPLSTPESVEAALQRWMERLHTISAILHRGCEELPEHQEALRKLSGALAAQEAL